jgi:hypothetical protein
VEGLRAREEVSTAEAAWDSQRTSYPTAYAVGYERAAQQRRFLSTLKMKDTQTFRCLTSFSKATLVETFEIADEGGAWKLREYSIAPTLPNSNAVQR